MTRPWSTPTAALAAGALVAAEAVSATAAPPAADPAAERLQAAAAEPAQIFGWNMADPVFDGERTFDRSADLPSVEDAGTGSIQVIFRTESTTGGTLVSLSDRDADTYLAIGLTDGGGVTYTVVDDGVTLTDVVTAGSYNDGAVHMLSVGVDGGQTTVHVDASPVHAEDGDAFVADLDGLDSFVFGALVSADAPEGEDFYVGDIRRVSAHDQVLGSAQLAAEAAGRGAPGAVLPEYDRLRQALTAGTATGPWLFTGDSITHGALFTYGWRSWSQHVEERLRWEMRRHTDYVVNTAISGHTAQDILDDWDDRVAAYDPGVVTIMVGMNDPVILGGAAGIDDYRADLVELVEGVRALDAVPVLATSEPIRGGASGTRATYPEYMATMREVAAEQGVILVDMHTDWLQRGDGTPPAAWWADDIHPSAQGHYEFARHYLQSLGAWDDAGALAAVTVPANPVPGTPATSLATDLSSTELAVAPGGELTLSAAATVGDYPANGVTLTLRPDPALELTAAPTASAGGQVVEQADGSYRITYGAAVGAGTVLNVVAPARVPADAAEGTVLTTSLSAALSNGAGSPAPATLEHVVVAEGEQVTTNERPGTAPQQTFGWTFAEPAFDGDRVVDHSQYASWVEGQQEGSLQATFATTSDEVSTLLSLSSTAEAQTYLAVGLDDGRITFRVVRDGETLTDVRTDARFNDGERHLVSVGVEGGQTVVHVDASPVLVEPGRAFIADLGPVDSFVYGALTTGEGTGEHFTGDLHRATVWSVNLGPDRLASIASSVVLEDYRALAAALADPRTRWLFTGDSITHGALHTHGARSWTQHVEERLRWERNNRQAYVLNTAISGHRAGDLVAGYDQRIGDLAPDVVTIMIGMNDAAAGTGGLAAYREQLADLITRVRADGAVPVVATSQPAPGRATYPEYLAAARTVAAEHGVFVVDTAGDWLVRNQGQTPRSWLADAIHPNGAGHHELARKFLTDLRVWDANSNVGRMRFLPVTMASGTLDAEVVVDAAEPVELTASVVVGSRAARDLVLTLVPAAGLEVLGTPQASLGDVVVDGDGNFQVLLPTEVPAGTEITVTAEARVTAEPGTALTSRLHLTAANQAGELGTAELRQLVTEPTTEEPTTEEPTTEEPTTEEPTTEEPTTEEPTTEEPTTEEPTTEEPTTEEPTTEEPTTEEPTTEEPTTEEPTTAVPTEEATTAQPTSEPTAPADGELGDSTAPGTDPTTSTSPADAGDGDLPSTGAAVAAAALTALALLMAGALLISRRRQVAGRG